MLVCQERIDIGGVSFRQLNGAWIAEDTILGHNVTIFPGAVLGRPPLSVRAQQRKVDRSSLAPLIIEDDCIIGAHAVVYRGSTVGRGCLIGDTACIREQVQIGESCIIAMGVTINYNTVVGSRVKVMDNSHLTGNMIVEDDVFISTMVTTTNDNSMGREAVLGVSEELRNRQGPIIRRHVTIGQSACILPGVEIGENTVVGANAVVTRPLPPRVLALGVPARVIRHLREDEIKK